MLGTFFPVLLESLGAGALVDSPMCRLVGLVRNHSLRILQVQHASLGCRVIRCKQVFQKLSELAMVRHVAAKDEAAIFMDNKDGIGPSPVTPMNFTVQAVDDNRKLDMLQSLQVAGITYLLLPGAMGRIIFRRVRLTGVEQKE